MEKVIKNYWWEPDGAEMRDEIARNLHLRQMRENIAKRKRAHKQGVMNK